jgi:hypothetical protein
LRASKRRKVSEPVESEAEPTEDPAIEEQATVDTGDDGFGGMTWECLAVTLEQFNDFIGSIEKSRDPNEKVLRKRLIDDVLPLLEKQEDARKRKQAQKGSRSPRSRSQEAGRACHGQEGTGEMDET